MLRASLNTSFILRIAKSIFRIFWTCIHTFFGNVISVPIGRTFQDADFIVSIISFIYVAVLNARSCYWVSKMSKTASSYTLPSSIIQILAIVIWDQWASFDTFICRRIGICKSCIWASGNALSCTMVSEITIGTAF
jgi:hypothetical protein